jgi:hypothetical protein
MLGVHQGGRRGSVLHSRHWWLIWTVLAGSAAMAVAVASVSSAARCADLHLAL